MNCPALPKSIWSHIRSFSGDMGYEPTPTARLMKNLCFSFDPYGKDPEFYRDGYSSLIVYTSDIAFFRKPSDKCRDRLCATCAIWNWSCANAFRDVPWSVNYLRFLHKDSDGYFIRSN